MRPVVHSVLITGAVVLLDQVTKQLAVIYKLEIERGTGFFNIATIIVLLAIFGGLYGIYFQKFSVGFPLIMGGAISNLLDRSHFGYVRDFIAIGIATVNVADIVIWSGIILLLIRTSPGLRPPSPGVGEGLGERS